MTIANLCQQQNACQEEGRRLARHIIETPVYLTDFAEEDQSRSVIAPKVWSTLKKELYAMKQKLLNFSSKASA